MTKDELARQIAINKSLGPDDDWPPEFDPNDIPIYMIILKDLRAALNDVQSNHNFDLGAGKIFYFFLLMIPDYVRENLATLTNEQYLAMREILEKHVEKDSSLLKKFPNWQPKDS